MIYYYVDIENKKIHEVKYMEVIDQSMYSSSHEGYSHNFNNAKLGRYVSIYSNSEEFPKLPNNNIFDDKQQAIKVLDEKFQQDIKYMTIEYKKFKKQYYINEL